MNDSKTKLYLIAAAIVVFAFVLNFTFITILVGTSSSMVQKTHENAPICYINNKSIQCPPEVHFLTYKETIEPVSYTHLTLPTTPYV